MPLRADMLAYRKPEPGKDCWIKDNILPDPYAVVERCYNKPFWMLGSPWRNEPWPGIRAPEALLPSELDIIKDWVKTQIGVAEIRPQSDTPTRYSSHNYVQIVGGNEGVARPHVDSTSECDYASVLYLHPCPPTKHAGTSIYRLRLPDGTLGGNICPPEYDSLSKIPGLEKMDLSMWQEELEVECVFNRISLYKSDFVHSATSYFGSDHQLYSKRITVTFFWKVLAG